MQPLTKTLAMIKMEKNFRAVIEKGYPRNPYDVLTNHYLLSRLTEEIVELIKAIDQQDIESAKLECADVSNIIDYLFERLSQGRTT